MILELENMQSLHLLQNNVVSLVSERDNYKYFHLIIDGEKTLMRGDYREFLKQFKRCSMEDKNNNLLEEIANEKT